MATKVEQATSVEPHRVQTSVTSSAGASTNSPKVSMFGVKSGFVIPKNKLSGSLVPIFRGGGKAESNDAAKEESPKQVQRKTKWGTDLTQDAAVRRGRILAYQTRVDQITQQLKSGALETGDHLGSESTSWSPNHESSSHQADNQSQKLEMLELERREVIGEIIKLNPSYKAPPDYKPLLKEAKVPIPLKLYPGYNFIGLIMGPGSNTQKRLEEETGAKIRIHGTKADGAEKGEITVSDGNEVQSAYEELYVHVSADTFDKVDAAVALIELLVTPIPGNSVAPTSVSVDTAPIAMVNPGVVQPMVGFTQQVPPPQLQYQQYRGPWFPLGPPHMSMRPQSGFIPHPNSSAPMPNNAIQFPQSPLNPSNMPPFLLGRPPTSVGFGLLPRNPNPSLVGPRQQPPIQSLQRPYMPESQPPNQVPPPRNYPMLGPQPPLAYNPTLPARPNSSVPHQVSSNQPMPTGPAPVSRPPLHSMRPASFPSQPSTPQQLNTQVNRPVMGPGFAYVPPPQGGPGSASVPMVASMPTSPPLPASGLFQTPSSMAPPPSLFPRAPSPAPNQSSPVAPSALPQQPVTPNSISGSLLSFTPTIPSMTSPKSNIQPVTAPKPQRSSSVDFTFQPLGPQLPTSQTVSRPSDQSLNTLSMPQKPMVQPPPAPQAPSYRSALHNPAPPQLGIRRFSIPQPIRQMVQPHVSIPTPSPGSVVPFTGNPSPTQPPPRFPVFPNPNPNPVSPSSQIGPRGFVQAPQISNLLPRLANPLQHHQNQLAPTIRPGNLMVPNQQYSNNLIRPASNPVNQVYDPFSPTSISVRPQQGDNQAKVRKQEADPEYEDLMASVGVR